MTDVTSLLDLIADASAGTCPARLAWTPFWRCDLPAGHRGEHASIHVNRFADADTRRAP